MALPTPSGGTKTSGASPLIHPRLKSLGFRSLESPLSSLHERSLASPGSTARRQLFSPGGTAASVHRSPVPIAPKPSIGGVPSAKPPGGGVTITPLNPNFLQHMKNSPAKSSSTAAGVKKTPPKHDNVTSSTGLTLSAVGGIVGGVSTTTTAAASAASKASTGTQTSPHRLPSTTAGSTTQQQQPSALSNILSSSSPPKAGITLTTSAGVVDLLSSNTSATVLSPSKITIGSLLSPRGRRTPLIPTSPPIPSVTITPSASPARTPQRTPATYGSSTTKQTLGMSATPGTPGSIVATRPKRTGSLALFYRKMYQLAYIRIRDLCERLELDTEFVQKYVKLKCP